MDVEARAKDFAERVGWPYAHTAQLRCAGIDDIARAMIAFSDERTRELREVLQEYLRDFGDNEDADSQKMAAKARALLGST